MVWIVFTVNMFIVPIMCYVVAGVDKSAFHIGIGTFLLSFNLLCNILPTIYGVINRGKRHNSEIEDGQFGLGVIGFIMAIIVTFFVTWVFSSIYGYN